MTGDILKLIFYLIAFFAVLWGAYVASKWLAARSVSMGFSSKFMIVADRVQLTKDSFLCIVRVGERYFLVGISSGEVNLLSELYEEDLVMLRDTQELANPVDSLREMFAGAASKLKKNTDSSRENSFYNILKKQSLDDVTEDSVDKIINESRKRTDRLKRKRSNEDENDED
ncbi:MAG: flagellar biosynthetic protein FliO [Oscillospiraceae bacterium]|nr:flagellar biosynthetic protein FliO [Oscillospiraceae bacterium]